VARICKASKLTFYNVNRNRKLGQVRVPESSLGCFQIQPLSKNWCFHCVILGAYTMPWFSAFLSWRTPFTALITIADLIVLTTFLWFSKLWFDHCFVRNAAMFTVSDGHRAQHLNLNCKQYFFTLKISSMWIIYKRKIAYFKGISLIANELSAVGTWKQVWQLVVHIFQFFSTLWFGVQEDRKSSFRTGMRNQVERVRGMLP